MADAFNPYREWLGVDAPSPTSHYQLLSLPLYEDDRAKITAAADRAMARVRGFRPGANAAAWSRLLDEVRAARECLLGAAKGEYDAALRAGNAAATAAPETVKPSSDQSSTRSHADFYPPGMGPGGKLAKDKPAAKRPEATEQARQPDIAPPAGSPQPFAATGPATQPSSPAPAEETPSPADVSAMMPPGAASLEPGTPAATAGSASSPAATAPGVPLAATLYGQQPLAGAPAAQPYAVPMAGVPMALPLGPMPFGQQPMGHMPMGQMPMGQMPMAWPAGYQAAPLAAPYAQPMNPYAGAPGLGNPTAGLAGYPSALPPQSPPPVPPPSHGGPPVGYGAPAGFGGTAFGGGAGFGGSAGFGSAAGASLDPMAPLSMPGVTGPMAVAPAAAPMSGHLPSGHIPMGSAVPAASSMPGPASAAGVSAAVGDQPLTLPKRSSATAAVLAAKRERKARQTLILAGSGGLLMLLVAGGIYVAMSNSAAVEVAQSQPSGDANPSGERVQPIERSVESTLPGPSKAPTQPDEDTRPTPTPAPTPMPAQPEQPAPKPESPAPAPAPPMPTPTPTPEPTPMPEPATTTPATPPTPAPAPTPEPPSPTPAPTPTPSPEPAPTVTRADAIKLGKALAAAKVALAEHNFDEADKQFAAAEPLAQLPEHRAKLTRLKEAAGYVKQFREAVAAAVAEMDAGATFKVGTSTQVAVVETFPDKIIVRTAGQNRTYPFQNLPPGLAVAIADFKFDAADPVTRMVKAAYLAVMKPDDEDVLSKAKALLEEAALGGVDTASVEAFLTDKYEDLAKDIPADGAKPPEEPKPDATASAAP